MLHFSVIISLNCCEKCTAEICRSYKLFAVKGESTSEKSPVKTAEKQGGKRTIDGNDETPSVSPKKKAKSAKGKDGNSSH